MKTLKNDFLHTNFLTMISISLFDCWKKVFSLVNIRMKKLNETSLPEKEDFHSYLNMEDITDADCTHAKRVSKDFEIKYLREYHDLYI